MAGRLSAALAGALAAGAAAAAVVLLPAAGRIVLPRAVHPERDALRDAGWTISPARWELLRLGAVVVAGLSALAAGLPVALAAAAAAAPSLVLGWRAQARRDRARGATVRLLGATSAALRSGASLPEALRRAAAGCDDAIARRPFETALDRFTLGDPLASALVDAAGRTADRRTRIALETLAVGVAERLPIERAAALVGAVADRASYDLQLDREVQARASGARLQTRVLAATVPTLALYLALTMPGLAETLGGPLGRTVLLPAAALLEVAGVVLGRRVVRGVSR